MKIKRILGGAIAAFMAVGMLSVPAFADDPIVTLEALAPTDIEGNEVTSLNAGDAIVIPIDAKSTDGYMTEIQTTITFDSSKMTLGINALASDEVTTYYTNNLDKLYLSEDEYTMYGSREIIKSVNAITGKVTYDTGTDTFNAHCKNAPDGTCYLNWMSAGAVDLSLNADTPEFYLFFTINDDVSIDSLNADLLTELTVKSSLGKDLTHEDMNYTGTTTKLNQCYGAFTVSIDESALNNTFITGLTANIYTDSNKGTELGSYALTEYVNDDGSTVYSFPTRITSNKDEYETAYVEIVAATNTEDAAGSTGTLTLGGKTIDLQSTVTDYAAAATVE